LSQLPASYLPSRPLNEERRVLQHQLESFEFYCTYVAIGVQLHTRNRRVGKYCICSRITRSRVLLTSSSKVHDLILTHWKSTQSVTLTTLETWRRWKGNSNYLFNLFSGNGLAVLEWRYLAVVGVGTLVPFGVVEDQAGLR
jgi:hypothetical protein